MPSTVATVQRVKCAMSYLCVDQELRNSNPVEHFAANSSGPCNIEITENCDHFYNGREDAIIELMVSRLNYSTYQSLYVRQSRK